MNKMDNIGHVPSLYNDTLAITILDQWNHAIVIESGL